MKHILLTLLLILGMWPAHGQSIIIKYPGYTCYWNPVTKIPDSVTWETYPHKRIAKRYRSFHSSLHSIDERKDYRNSGYDIGHNCDAADESGSELDEFNSFDYANSFPQVKSCNRVTWFALENKVRYLSKKNGSVKNKVYWQGIAGYVGPDHITIPEYCIKEIWYGDQHEVYRIPNNDTCLLHPVSFYRVE